MYDLFLERINLMLQESKKMGQEFVKYIFIKWEVMIVCRRGYLDNYMWIDLEYIFMIELIGFVGSGCIWKIE